MKFLLFFSILLSSISSHAGAKARLNAGPYIQSTTTDSVSISWETTIGDSSRVYWGETKSLENEIYGNGVTGYLTTEIHTVDLKNLKPDTTYYYQIDSHLLTTQIFSFKTAPLRDSEKSFRFAVYSDNQQQSDVHESVILGIQKTLEAKEYSLSDKLAFTLVAGDIVQEGNRYWQYRTRFFNPTQSMTPYVPFYIAIGNHEEDSDYYFNYFNFPKNGTPQYKEHWYSFQYSNTHLIALDTNVGYRLKEQLDWLEKDLKTACKDLDTDFIFTFFHHPHHSELWIDGDTEYSKDVIDLVEDVISSCNKQGAIFFGHTHGYSRGQRKDSSLYLVNVASAGGHLDQWGDWPIQDLDEFQYSIDEYGYLIVEVNAGSNPSFELKRYSLGDDFVSKDNELQDVFGIRVDNQKPKKPNITKSVFIQSNQVTHILESDQYDDQESDLHIESEWKIIDEKSGVSLFEKWKRYENLFFEKTTTESLYELELDEKSSEIQHCLQNGCYFQVRYRDSNLNWSQWSDKVKL